MKNKLCFITTISKTMDWFVCDSTRNLSRHGYDVTLISNMEQGFIERNEYAKCISLKMERGIVIKDIIPTIWKLYQIFKLEKYDIVQYTTPNAAFYASIASWLARVPVRLYSQWGIRYVGLAGIKRKIFKLVEKITCMLSTDIRGVSPLNRDLAVDEGLCRPDKIKVIGKGGTIGVDLSVCASSKKQDWKAEIRTHFEIPQLAYVYGYVGRINADKGINELITAFRSMLQKDDSIFLMLVGMYDDSNAINSNLYQWARESGRVFFTGNVPSNEVYKYMAAFDVLVHPTYREGFGKVLQEAMGMSLPIITTNIPGPSEVVEEGKSGILVEARNAVALENAMYMLKKSPKLCNQLGSEARKQAELYYDRKIMLENILLDMDSLVRKDQKINV